MLPTTCMISECADYIKDYIVIAFDLFVCAYSHPNTVLVCQCGTMRKVVWKQSWRSVVDKRMSAISLTVMSQFLTHFCEQLDNIYTALAQLYPDKACKCMSGSENIVTLESALHEQSMPWRPWYQELLLMTWQGTACHNFTRLYIHNAGQWGAKIGAIIMVSFVFDDLIKKQNNSIFTKKSVFCLASSIVSRMLFLLVSSSNVFMALLRAEKRRLQKWIIIIIDVLNVDWYHSLYFRASCINLTVDGKVTINGKFCAMGPDVVVQWNSGSVAWLLT